MIIQEIDHIKFKMRKAYDFSFLQKYGTVFQIYDDQDSGNICFGIEKEKRKLFVKFAGAPTAEYSGTAKDAITRLKETVPLYQELRQESLIKYIDSEEIGDGFAMIFQWVDGICMGRMYEKTHQIIMALPIEEKMDIYQSIITFLKDTMKAGFLAVDFYDGSILYDPVQKKTTICDIDLYRKCPSKNDMGRMWGSSRFLSPEELELGAELDEITNVFTLGQMGFSLFTDSDRTKESWPLSQKRYQVLKRAIDPDRKERYQSIEEFERAWNKI